MGYINNGNESSSVQGVLESPPQKTNNHTMYLHKQRSVDTQTKQRIRPPYINVALLVFNHQNE